MPSFEELNEDQMKAYAKAAHALHGDPETSKEFKQLLKKKNPSFRDPELDMEEQVTKSLEPLAKKVRAMEEEREKEKALSEREQARRKIEERGLDFDKVEKFAQEKRIASYETAADYFEMEARMATPTSPGLAFQKAEENIRGLFNNPQKLNETRRAKANEAITELRRGRRMI